VTVRMPHEVAVAAAVAARHCCSSHAGRVLEAPMHTAGVQHHLGVILVGSLVQCQRNTSIGVALVARGQLLLVRHTSADTMVVSSATVEVEEGFLGARRTRVVPVVAMVVVAAMVVLAAEIVVVVTAAVAVVVMVVAPTVTWVVASAFVTGLRAPRATTTVKGHPHKPRVVAPPEARRGSSAPLAATQRGSGSNSRSTGMKRATQKPPARHATLQCRTLHHQQL
jgi:hypothetical protein